MFLLSDAEKKAEGKSIASVTIHYHGREKTVDYPWANRKQINWDQVRRCRLNFEKVKSYNINGEACTRPGIRMKK